jgi:hypothetical protein
VSAVREGWRELAPEPSRLWLRWAPAAWPAPAALWTDLASGRCGGTLPPPAGWPPPVGLLEPDVLYLPPVSPPLARERHELARTALRAGHAVIWQGSPPGDPEPVPAGVLPAWDLLPLFAGEAPWPAALPAAGGVALWPLAPGLAGPPASWGATLSRLDAAGVAAVLGVTLDLTPGDRRRLADRRGEPFSGPLFHAEPPDWRLLARLVRRAGLAWGIPRPPVARPLAWRQRNRELAGLFAEAAERWAEAGEPEAAGQELWRAAREAERAERDLAALAREGQLGLFVWLDEGRRRFVEEWAAGRRPELLARLEARLFAAAKECDTEGER